MKNKKNLKEQTVLTLLEVNRDPRVSHDALRFYLEVAGCILVNGKMELDDEWWCNTILPSGFSTKRMLDAFRRAHYCRRRLSKLGYLKYEFIKDTGWGYYRYTIPGLSK